MHTKRSLALALAAIIAVAACSPAAPASSAPASQPPAASAPASTEPSTPAASPSATPLAVDPADRLLDHPPAGLLLRREREPGFSQANALRRTTNVHRLAPRAGRRPNPLVRCATADAARRTARCRPARSRKAEPAARSRWTW